MPQHKRSHAELEKRRKEAGRMFREGKSQAEVAKRFKVSRAAACQWYMAWNKEGMQGLDSKGPTGFPSQLGEKDKNKFRQAILRGPLAHGYPTDLWTLSRLAEVMEKTAGVRFTEVWVWHIMRDLGFTPQKPQVKAKERDEKAIADWKTRRLPGIKKMGSRTWVLSRV